MSIYEYKKLKIYYLKKIVLISGIKGFLARNLVSLLKEEYTIIGIGKKKDDLDGVKVFESSKIEDLACQPDFIVMCHAAVASGGSTPITDSLFEVNVALTKKIINKFPNSKIIYISSVSLYDANTILIKEESPIYPLTEYAISKLWAEQIVLKTNNAIVFRLSSVFGMGMKENTIIPNYTNQALKNKIIEVWGIGERKQNYIQVVDVCHYIKIGIEKFDSLKNNVLLAVSKKEFSNNELAQIIADKTEAKIVYVNQDNSKSMQCNNDLTSKLLNWTPNDNFTVEIENYIKWKKEQF